MADNTQELTLEEKVEVAMNDVQQVAEALMEHISNLDDQVQAVTDQIVQGVEQRIREIVREELANGSTE